MKIIDRETGQRLKEADPLKRNVDRGLESIENSPMDPPDAYSIPAKEEDAPLHPLLLQLKADHVGMVDVATAFEEGLRKFIEGKYHFSEEVNTAFKDFFNDYDEKVLPLLHLERQVIYPELQKQLLLAGEHSKEDTPKTVVDLLEDDHVKIIQLGALSFNFFGLAARLSDEKSRMFVLDTACGNARELIEVIKLHYFREDNSLFPMVGKYINKDELDGMFKRIKR